MFNQVKVFDGEGNLKQVLSSEDLTLNHWGADRKCKGCDILFRVKKGKKQRKDTYESSNFVRAIVPDGEYCNPKCKFKHLNSKDIKTNGNVYGVGTCDICEKPMKKKTFNQLRHTTEECRKRHDALVWLKRKAKAKEEKG